MKTVSGTVHIEHSTFTGPTCASPEVAAAVLELATAAGENAKAIAAAARALRGQARGLAEEIVRSTPKSREQSLALTHLETAIFFANAAIARNE